MNRGLYWRYHLKQYEKMYRSTASMIEFLKFRIPERDLLMLDVGCGAGANIFWLRKSGRD
jgi:predicted RNA methylase